MIQSKRLFDAVQYQLNKYPKNDMLASKVNGIWKPYSTAEIKDIVNKYSAGLLHLGISGNDLSDEGSDKIGIISGNRPEWVFTDLAVQQTGAVLVPVYPTTNNQELEYIFNHAEIKYIFVGNKDLFEKIKSISDKIPSLKGIFSFDEIDGVTSWSKIMEMATPESLQRVEEIKNTIHEDHLATIIYTSGTTGTPKGVMLTHKNMMSNLMASKKSFPIEDCPQEKALSFLPLNHIFERLLIYVYFYSSVGVYFAESIDTISENLKEIKPEIFTCVPRLLEKVYERIVNVGNKLTGIKRLIFVMSVKLANRYDNTKPGNFWYNIRFVLADKLVFSKWREALGGNMRICIVAGAACQEKLIRVFNAAKIPVYEGYGSTENSPVIAVNRCTSGGNRFGTVGPAIVDLDIKLAEDGEICVKGDSIMKGYYKNPELTAEVIKDGWLLTGDIGTWVDNKFLKITDRKKELFKTSGGKYVAPQPIENMLKESVYVEHALIIGSERKFVSALIVPHFGSLKTWMGLNHIPYTTNEAAIQNEKVIALFNSIVESTNKDFNKVEQVKKFALLEKDWSTEGGELTPKLSVKRKVIKEKFKAIIEDIYSES